MFTDFFFFFLRERNISVRQKHQSVALHTRPDWGSKPDLFGVWKDAPTN